MLLVLLALFLSSSANIRPGAGSDMTLKHCWKFDPLPKMVIFDLDMTIWPFKVYRDVTPPFYKGMNGLILDSEGRNITLYPDILEILRTLRRKQITLAIASRSTRIDLATELFKLFDINHYFKYSEIYAGVKKIHLEKIRNESGIKFRDMLFFDDEEENIDSANELNITTFKVEDGLHIDELKRGFQKFVNEQKLS